MKLLKGIVEKDDVVWNDVLDYQSEILDYISVMGWNHREKDEVLPLSSN